MADAVKKSRIVSDEDTDLEEALLEEFNLRLKTCMSQDDLHQKEETDADENCQNTSNKPNGISCSDISATKDFLRNETYIVENYYDVPKTLTNGTKTTEHIGEESNDRENIYEVILDKTEEMDQNYTDMTENTKTDLTSPVDVSDSSSRTIEDYEIMSKPENTSGSSYEFVEAAPEDHPKPSFTLPTTCLEDFSEVSPDYESKSSVKDRMFLCTNETSTLLFTQTVTSPMLTPSDENIDFLKGFQRENTNSDSTPPVDEEKVEKSDSSTEVEEKSTENNEEQLYENTEFLKNRDANMYENLKLGAHENIYESLDKEEECIYEHVESLAEKDLKDETNAFLQKEKEKFEPVLENGHKDEQNGAADIESQLAEAAEDIVVIEETETQAEETSKLEETKTESQNQTSVSIVEATTKTTNDTKIVEDSVKSLTNARMESETYTEFVHHVKSENSSNYYEKYTEVLSKNAKNGMSNREKDTETVPAEIVKNLKSQFLTKTGTTETVVPPKKESGGVELKTVNIMKHISKFEHKDSGDAAEVDDSTEYSETIVESSGPGERCIKKKKTKKTRTSEKENISVKSSFSKFDALQKKNVLHIRSSDSSKAQEKFNGAQIDTTSCKKCSKQVFQMEQIKAEKAVWHKNCFRCTECNKQLTVDTYESHEGNLYCKPHFKALFAPKVVEEEAPPSDKPDLGLEELSSLNVKERFQVFENYQSHTEVTEQERGSTPVKRSPSILSKLAKFQKHGMDVGVSNEQLDGIPIEESSSEEEQEEEVIEGEDADLVRARKVQKEKPFHFTGMSDVKKKWETGDQELMKDERREERKQEIQTIRNRLFLGKQEKMKEAYQQAVMSSESCTNVKKNITEQIEVCDTKSIKDRFEKGEVLNEKQDKSNRNEEEEEVYESEMSKKSRSLFLELDASASKPPQMSPITPPKLDVKKARETESPEREIYRDPDVVRSEEVVEDSVIAKERHTATKMLNKFRQMEENLQKEPQPAGPKPLKRFTPPPEPARPESNSEEEESEEEYEEEEEVDHSRLPEDVIEAQKAARAKQLRAKFEKWEQEEIRREQQNVNITEEYGEEQQQIESTKILRARFESMQNSSSEKKSPRVKVNRFVVPPITESCRSCSGKVYPLEKISVHGQIYHKKCFKCMECSCILRMDSYSFNKGLLYCMPHFKRLFISKGNYDTAFGLDQHKEKWNINATVA